MGNSYRRLDDLLLARATRPLSPTEALELERLHAMYPRVDRDPYERAAALLCLATLDSSEPMPAELRTRIERQAAEFLAGKTPRTRR